MSCCWFTIPKCKGLSLLALQATMKHFIVQVENILRGRLIDTVKKESFKNYCFFPPVTGHNLYLENFPLQVLADAVSGETPPAVLCPALEFSIWEGYCPVGASPEKGHQVDHSPLMKKG